MDFGILVNVAIGVGAVLILFSIATSAVHEYISDNWLNLRGKTLAQVIGKILSDNPGDDGAAPGESLFARLWAWLGRAFLVLRSVFGGRLPALYRGSVVEDFYAAGEIRVLMNGRRLPSAIEAERFARTAVAVLLEREERKTAFVARVNAASARLGEDVRDAARAAGFEDVGTWAAAELAKGAGAVGAAGDTALAAVDAVVADLEREYDEVMDRASGWYLRNTKLVLFLIGLALAVGSNVDMLRYADRLLTAGDIDGRVETITALVGSDGWDDLIRQHEKRQAEVAALSGDDKPVDAPAEAAVAPVGAAGGPEVAPDKMEEIVGSEALRREADLILGHLGTLEVKVGWDCMDVPADLGVIWFSEDYCAWRTGLKAAERGTGPAAPTAASARLGLATPTASQAIGWILIAFGVTFGARMWFDLVKSLINLRTAGLTGRLGKLG